MENFWFDTPFGIAGLGGIISAALGLVWLLLAALRGRPADRFRLARGELLAGLGWLALYGVMMVITSYLIIVVVYLARGFLHWPFLWPTMIGLWAVCAVLLFRGLFRR